MCGSDGNTYICARTAWAIQTNERGRTHLENQTNIMPALLHASKSNVEKTKHTIAQIEKEWKFSHSLFFSLQNMMKANE